MWKVLPAFFLLVFLPPAASIGEDDPRLIIDPRGPSGVVWELLFTPDGGTLISLGDDKAIRFWDVGSGDLRKTLRLETGDGPEGKLFAGAISPDGKWLAVGGLIKQNTIDGPIIRLIDLEQNVVAAVLRGHSNVIRALAFSDDGRWLASGSGDASVRVWDWEGAREQGQPGKVVEITESQKLEGHSADVSAVSFAPGGDRLVSGAYDHKLILWKRDSDAAFAHAATLEQHGAEVHSAAFSPDGRHIVSGGFDHRLLLWDGREGRFLRALEEDMEYYARAVTSSPDSGRVLASSAPTGYTAIYDVESGERTVKFTQHTNSVLASAWHPSGDLVASAGGDDNDIYLWRPGSGEVVHHLRGDGRPGFSVAFASQTGDGLKVAFGNQNMRDDPEGLQLLEYELEHIFDFTTFTLSDLASNAAGEAETSFRRTIPGRGGVVLKKNDTYHLQTGSGEISHDPKRYNQIRSYSFTPSGDVVVGSSFTLQLHSPTGETRQKFIGHEGEVCAISPSPDGRYLASASNDQTVRLWNLETGDLLASLFVARDGEWVCWTPSGHYHASAGGEKYIGWHLNQGLDKVAGYYPAYVFREQFHHPELVKRTVMLGDFDKALAEVGAKKVNVAEVLPPKIDWILPQSTSGGKVAGQVTVRAEISSPKAELEEVKLLVNGKALAADFRAYGNSMTYEQTVELLPGENRLAIFARNGNSGHTSDERVVTVRGGATPATAEGQGQGAPATGDGLDELLKPNLYVLAVGVSDYEDSSVPALEYCDDDATAIAGFFQKQGGGIFGKTEVKLLADGDATESAIQKGLDWLEDSATQKDFVVLFLAAHGLNDEKGNFYLLPHDADPESLRSTGVAWDDFGEILGNLPSRVLMFLDTCHSGQLGANLFTLANVSGTRNRSLGGLKSAFDPSEAIRELTSEENGVVIMAASTGNEESIESDEWGHGAFTMGLLEGLGGKADVNEDGIIHVRELDFFISDRVKELTGGVQHPTTVKPSTISRLPVAAVR